jgi:hypothetical protein
MPLSWDQVKMAAASKPELFKYWKDKYDLSKMHDKTEKSPTGQITEDTLESLTTDDDLDWSRRKPKKGEKDKKEEKEEKQSMTPLQRELKRHDELMQAWSRETDNFGKQAARFAGKEKKFLGYTKDPKRAEDDPSGEKRKSAYREADRARESKKSAIKGGRLAKMAGLIKRL